MFRAIFIVEKKIIAQNNEKQTDVKMNNCVSQNLQLMFEDYGFKDAIKEFSWVQRGLE